jgi:aerobic carbon-monoxide dehydrogenase medium subunit
MTNATPQYFRPKDWASAHDLLARPDLQAEAMFIAPRPLALTEVEAGAWVDLSQLDINYIKSTSGKIHIGMLATMEDLNQSELLHAQAGGMLCQAAYLSATLGIRNLASIGGAITARQGPAEILLVLLALEARLVIQAPGLKQRQLSLADFLAGGGQDLGRGEALVEVFFEDASAAGGSLERVARTPRDQAIVAAVAAIRVKGKVVESVHLACSGASLQPERLPEVESLFNGQQVTEELLKKAADWVSGHARPVADYRGSMEYRRAAAGVLCSRAVKFAWKQAAGSQDVH